MRKVTFILALCSLTSMYALTSLDDLLIKNNTDKTIGIIWFIGGDYTEKGMGNLMSPAILAPKGQQLPGAEAYFPNTDSKSLKKDALQAILNVSKPVTGALIFDMNNPDEQRIVKFDDYKTGTVNREGKTYPLTTMTIIGPPAYYTGESGWKIISTYDMSPEAYNKLRQQIGRIKLTV
jgi:hypothetical protein